MKMDREIQELYELLDKIRSEADRVSLKKEIEQLEEDLKEAEKAGDKEKAAKIRKKIKELRDKLAGYGYSSRSDDKEEDEVEDKADVIIDLLKEIRQDLLSNAEGKESVSLDVVMQVFAKLFGITTGDVAGALKDALLAGDVDKAVQLIGTLKPGVYEKPPVYEKSEQEDEDDMEDLKEMQAKLEAVEKEKADLQAKVEELTKQISEKDEQLKELQDKLAEIERRETASARMKELKDAGVTFESEEIEKEIFELLGGLDDEAYELQKKLLLSVKSAASKEEEPDKAKASAPVTETSPEESKLEKYVNALLS